MKLTKHTIVHLLVMIILIVQIYIDPVVRKCKSKLGVVMIIFHQFLNMTILFGSILFGCHEYHLILLVGSFLVHKLAGICPLTKIHNKLCGVDEKKPLITILNRFVPNYPNNTNNVILLYYVLLATVVVYDIWSIIKKRKSAA